MVAKIRLTESVYAFDRACLKLKKPTAAKPKNCIKKKGKTLKSLK